MAANTPAYISAAELRRALGFESNDDFTNYSDEDLQKTQELAQAANTHIATELRPYEDIAAGNPHYDDVKRAALIYAQWRWHQYHYQYETAKSYKETFDADLEAIKEALRVEPTSRRDPIDIQHTTHQQDRLAAYSQIGYGASEESLY